MQFVPPEYSAHDEPVLEDAVVDAADDAADDADDSGALAVVDAADDADEDPGPHLLLICFF